MPTTPPRSSNKLNRTAGSPSSEFQKGERGVPSDEELMLKKCPFNELMKRISRMKRKSLVRIVGPGQWHLEGK